MAKTLSKTDGYKTLVKQVSRELTELETFIKRRTAEGYWRIGKFIDDHLLANKERAEYGTTLFAQLAKDTDRDITTLRRAVQFYRVYPIRADQRELTWDHYKSLITIKNFAERKKIEEKVIRNDWSTTKLQEYLSAKRESAAPENDQPIPQLKFFRGKLHTYRIVKANPSLAEKSSLALDLGFRMQYCVPGNGRFKEDDLAELVFSKGSPVGAKKAEATPDEIFTYQAKVDRIIDGDTLLVSFDFKLAASISQKLRLRGIDCPEMDTEEGKKAKRFVEASLKGCDFIIVKTYKDRSDKFDRYLADVFCLKGESDAVKVAAEGEFLNQKLLDEGLARPY